MSRAPKQVALPGFFGKVPARGDFVSRRVPAALAKTWEEFLSRLVVDARAQLAEDWEEEWLIAPLWHFVLGRQICPPAGAAGVLMASVDRVGRLYPFTIIGPAAPGVPHQGGAWTPWNEAIEALSLDALEDDFDPDTFDVALASVGPPAMWEGPSTRAGHWRLDFSDGAPAEPADILDDSALRAPGPDQSVWFSGGSDLVAPMHLRCLGLPDAETAVAMISGAFDFQTEPDV
jgi:type VI secretion system protein ImpM